MALTHKQITARNRGRVARRSIRIATRDANRRAYAEYVSSLSPQLRAVRARALERGESIGWAEARRRLSGSAGLRRDVSPSSPQPSPPTDAARNAGVSAMCGPRGFSHGVAMLGGPDALDNMVSESADHG